MTIEVSTVSTTGLYGIKHKYSLSFSKAPAHELCKSFFFAELEMEKGTRNSIKTDDRLLLAQRQLLNSVTSMIASILLIVMVFGQTTCQEGWWRDV